MNKYCALERRLCAFECIVLFAGWRLARSANAQAFTVDWPGHGSAVGRRKGEKVSEREREGERG